MNLEGRNFKASLGDLRTAHRGEDKVKKKVGSQSLRLEFEKFEMKEEENNSDYFTRVTSMLNQMSFNGKNFRRLKSCGENSSKFATKIQLHSCCY